MQTTEQLRFALPLDASEATLETVGGKGASLARLTTAGLPVPSGFHLTTAAYRRFVEEHQLQPAILEAAGQAVPDNPASFEQASETIRALFEGGTIPEEIAVAIREAYTALDDGEPAVAVRSSATAEDLPGASFAGQQETFLNVRGMEALLDAVRRCWASLWTGRALAYRARQGIPSEDVTLAVVVQVMVPADISGVLFTANPTTGARDELLVNAAWGLGESIVGGEVTPDSYRIDKTSLQITETTLGSKDQMVVPGAGQGTVREAVPATRQQAGTLTTQLARELAELGVRAEALFDDVPQDIEWAIAGGTCWVVQSRPITGLPPAPLKDVTWEPPIPGSKWIRRQVVENMPDPLSPLFEDLYLPSLEHGINPLMEQMGMPRSLFEEMIERPLFTTVNGYAYMRTGYRTSLKGLSQILRGGASGKFRYIFQHGVPIWRDEGLPAYLTAIEDWTGLDRVAATDDELLQGIRSLTDADAAYWWASAIVIGAAKITDGLLDWFVSHATPGSGRTSGRYLRGFPSKTLEAEAGLEELAARIRRSEALMRVVAATPAAQLRTALGRTSDGQAFLDAFAALLEHSGHQGYTFDFAVPTQADDPLPLLLSLKVLVGAPPRDIEARRKQMAHERDAAVERTARSLDPIRRRLFRLLVGWAQRFGPYREQALFYCGAGWPTLRGLANELGKRLVAVGTLESPDDIFFLKPAELEAASADRASGAGRPDLGQLARARRELREARKRIHPPPAVPIGEGLKLGPIDLSSFETQQRNTDDGAVLRGFAVSPGRVTGVASVIRSPADFEQMQPDSILVCPTTTPAWTPLFSQARGLVTDIGGILAHGSIVAREYGIPAVMGTGNATERIVNGQLLAVDGDAGTVTLLDDDEAGALPDAPTIPNEEPTWSVRPTIVRAALAAGLAAAVALWWRRRLWRAS